MEIVVDEVYVGHEYDYQSGKLVVLGYDTGKNSFLCYYNKLDKCLVSSSDKLTFSNHHPYKIFIVVKPGFIYPVGSIFLEYFEKIFEGNLDLIKWMGKYREYCVEITNDNLNM